jgi:hypothetical protein
MKCGKVGRKGVGMGDVSRDERGCGLGQLLTGEEPSRVIVIHWVRPACSVLIPVVVLVHLCSSILCL